MIQVLNENKALFDKIGISRWHDAGYTGKRGLSITFERPYIYPVMNGQVENLWSDISPVYYQPDNSLQTHAYFTTMVHLQVAPERQIKSVLTWGVDGETSSGFIVDTFLPWMLENKPDVGFRSLYGKVGFESIFAQTPFCTLCNAAGNDGATDYIPGIASEYWLGIGAVNSNFIPEKYSSESEHVDFCGIAPFYVPTTVGTATTYDGTSTATPFIAGQMALVNDFFIDKIGRPLSMREMYAFVQLHSLDIAVPGKDKKTGHGVFIMPDPATINPNDWVTGGSIVIPVTYGNHSAWSTEAVKYCVDKGYFKGDGNGNFRWQDTITREELAQLLYNIKA